MEKKKLGKLSLKKEAISHLRPGTQARILGGGSDFSACMNTNNDPCDTVFDCPCNRTDTDCTYIPPESAVGTALPSVCEDCPRPTYDCTVI